MTYHSDPVPFWCPLDPALWAHIFPGFGGSSAELSGRAICSPTVSGAKCSDPRPGAPGASP